MISIVPRVLVLEPYADLRSEIAATLQRADYVCDAVGTAEDAVLKLDRNTYQFVLIDMDESDSRALVAGIDPAAHVILLTNGENQRAGYVALRKPFGRAELMAQFTN
ncbi:MAG TPA: hypothetical protein VND45_01280 [Thermoanaerobaculia bacterium]|jgi:DNA-binding response OmpR family regulator|nr:hypothetical protein [Thermoanaerobaculia bacterium]